MTRRTLFKTLFGTTLATAFGLEKTVAKEGIIYCDYLPIITESFPSFFERVNGFKMNERQWMMWEAYLSTDLNEGCFRRQSGVSTFLATLAYYEAEVHGKDVVIISPNGTLNSNMHGLLCQKRFGGIFKHSHLDGVAHHRFTKGSILCSDKGEYVMGRKIDILLSDNSLYGLSTPSYSKFPRQLHLSTV